MVDPTSGTYTEINEWGPEVTAGELETLTEKLHYLARGADFVVLSGSLPRKVPTSFYGDAVRDLARRDVRVVLDSEGEPLRLGVDAGPTSSLRTSVRRSSSSGRSSRTTTTSSWRSTRSPRWALATSSSRSRTVLRALLRIGRKTRRMRAFAPHVEPVSGVGSGDVLLAQFLAAIVEERSPDYALRLAVAAGAASVREVGAGRFNASLAATLAADIELAELHPVRS